MGVCVVTKCVGYTLLRLQQWPSESVALFIMLYVYINKYSKKKKK